MLPVTDAMMLGSKVDGVIVVARARLASRPHMVALARALDACAAPTLGFLFTGVSVSEENEYGGYVGVGGAGLSQPRTPTRETRTAVRVVLVCSSGGHLIQLHQLKPWWEKHERTWVTFDLPDGRSLLEGEDVVWAHHPTTRNVRNAFKNLMLAVRMLPRYRPDVVVSDGAGVAFPFFVVARMLANQDRLPRGLRPHRLGDAHGAPVPPALEPLSGAVGGAAAPLPRGQGHRRALLNPELPLVFVSVGTDFHPFDRLCSVDRRVDGRRRR